jgi:hypothetical protein
LTVAEATRAIATFIYLPALTAANPMGSDIVESMVNISDAVRYILDTMERKIWAVGLEKLCDYSQTWGTSIPRRF